MKKKQMSFRATMIMAGAAMIVMLVFIFIVGRALVIGAQTAKPKPWRGIKPLAEWIWSGSEG